MNDDELTGRRIRVHVAWTPERQAAAFRRLSAARASGIGTGAALLAVAVAAAVIVVITWPGRGLRTSLVAGDLAGGRLVPGPAAPSGVQVVPGPWSSSESVSSPARPGQHRRLRFRDGSIALLTSPETDLKVETVEDDRIVSALLAGTARFQVAKRPSRVFRVLVGDASVEVLGTTFDLERRGDRLGVKVIEGRVKVAWSGGERRLGAGEEGTFSLGATPPALPATAPTTPASSSSSSVAVRSRSSSPPGSNLAARDRASGPHHRSTGRSVRATVASDCGTPGHIAARPAPPSRSSAEPGVDEAPGPRPDANAQPANEATASRGVEPPLVEDSLAVMLRTADQARAGGRSVDAATALRAASAQEPSDPRVSLAEFRLGRLLLEDLGQPREAAAAFERARALAPTGPLAPDALAREVQARSVAGDRERARALAREYLTRYPAGTHAARVRRWGAIE